MVTRVPQIKIKPRNDVTILGARMVNIKVPTEDAQILGAPIKNSDARTSSRHRFVQLWW